MKTIKEVGDYAEKIIPLIGLSHWDIGFSKEKESNEYPCTNDVQYRYKKSCIRFYPDFFTVSVSEQKTLIIHELLHCHTGFTERAIDKLKDNQWFAHNRAMEIGNDICYAEEECVELLARAIYKLIEND